MFIQCSLVRFISSPRGFWKEISFHFVYSASFKFIRRCRGWAIKSSHEYLFSSGPRIAFRNIQMHPHISSQTRLTTSFESAAVKMQTQTLIPLNLCCKIRVGLNTNWVKEKRCYLEQQVLRCKMDQVNRLPLSFSKKKNAKNSERWFVN